MGGESSHGADDEQATAPTNLTNSCCCRQRFRSGCPRLAHFAPTWSTMDLSPISYQSEERGGPPYHG